VQKRKTKATMQPANDIRVGSLPFSGEEEGQALINNRSGCTHTTRSRENQGAKAPMLNLPYMFFILVTLMLMIRVGLV